ncbi:N-alpha-acetyltransferase 50 [Entomortierella lignicola]|nr:N-alpha-acetyltransferase 50 [Entomortierella lignicola]
MTPPAIEMDSTTNADKPKSAAFRVGLGDVTVNNLGQVKRLNSILFPIVYNASFYKEILEVGEFAKIVYFNDICVGAVCCRKEAIEETTTMQNLYIATLGVLAPYRHLGLGSKLLAHILENAELPSSTEPKIGKVYLHVQVKNEEALEFYKKHGFHIADTIPNYYPQFDDNDAHRLEKVLNEV